MSDIARKDTVDLVNLSFSCVCGKTHTIPIELLVLKRGALHEMKSQLESLRLSGRGGIVYDKKIEEGVVSGVLDILRSAGLSFASFSVGDGHEDLKPDKELAFRVAEMTRGMADHLIAVGSGVISDLVRYAAFLLDLPCVFVPTAPSMNGYTSSIAALAEHGIKKTLSVPPARAVFADITLLQRSPVEMVRSGLGDIVSKSVCNADWKLSQLVKKSYFCPLPFRITDRSESLYLEAAREIGERTEYGITVLTDSILRSGLSMTMVGTSTPSSGAEHLLSHYWDFTAMRQGKKIQFHGTQVGVATLIMLRLYDSIRGISVKEVNLKRLGKGYPSKERLSSYLEQKFGSYAKGIKEDYFKKYARWKVKKQELEYIIEDWVGIWNELDPYIRPAEQVESALKECGCAVHFSQLGKEREEMIDSLLNAAFIRGRYTILDLAADLGILKEAALRIL